jgi:hypothetical protein
MNDIASEKETLIQYFSEQLLQNVHYSRINQARKEAEAVLGQTIVSGSPLTKLVDESIEAAVVRSASRLLPSCYSTHQVYNRFVDLLHQQPTLGVRSSTSIAQQAYSTPIPIAYFASVLAGITPEKTVYEPTAGNGALLVAADPAKVIANELNGDRFKELSKRGYHQLTQQDATHYRPDAVVDVMITNPPFGTRRLEPGKREWFELPGNRRGTNQIDHAIALKALETIHNQGQAVLILGGKEGKNPNWRSDQYNTILSRGFFYALYQQYNVIDHFTIWGDLYRKQGTSFPIDVVVIDGRGQSARALPAADVPRIYTSFDQLKEVLPNEPILQPQRVPTVAVALDSVLSHNDRAVSGALSGRPTPDDPTTLPNLHQTAVSTLDSRLDERNRGDPSRDSPTALQSAVRARTDAGATKVGGSLGVAGGVGRFNHRVQRDVFSEVELSHGAQFSLSDASPDSLGAGAASSEGGGNRSAPVARRADQWEDLMADEAGDELLVPYVPGSQGPSPGTLIPANLASAAQAALHRLQHQVGDIDTFVRQRLGYASNEEMFTRLYAEQIDSAAFAFWQRDQGKAFLNADQTGNGKGRWCGTQVIDTIRQGQTAVWITQQADLYAAALSDLADLGATNLRVFATNTGLKLTLPDGTQLKTLPAAKQEAEMKRILAGEAKYDLIFSTYSQLQTVNKKEPFRREFFKQLAPSATFIFDEAHQAGGQTGERGSNDKTRSLLVRELVDKAASVVFATATAVKDPDILDLYARRTDAIDVVPIHTLQNALHDGGIPLQQMVTAKFAEAGQMLRRERSYDGVKLNLQTLAVDREAADQFCACLGAISRFEIVKDAVVERMREQLKEQAKAILGDSATGDIGARSTNFTSLIHNIVSQSLLGLKADAITDIAIGAKAQEQKPVIACVSTMESHLTRYSEENNIGAGDPVDLTYADLLRHNLERSREVRTKNYQGECEVRSLTDAELGAGGVTAYEEAMTLINSVDLSAIPMSFIDYSQWKLEAAGMTVGEITGRKTGLDYRNSDLPIYSIRDGSDITPQAKVDTVAGFNNGRLDALVINSAGFTGISIQASERYADQAQRHLIVGQIHTDINQVMQMFGRVNRFGQVNAPEITIAFSDLPAERRIAALLADRMARLNANTTANRDSSLSCVTASQFFSPYGEEAIESILKEYPEYNYKLAYPRDASGEGELTLISRVTGRMPLMSVADQEKLYQLIDTEVAALIEIDKLTGHNPLAADQLDLDARTIARVELIPPVKVGNVFGGAVYAEVLDVKRPVQPMTQLEVLNIVRAQVGLTAVQRVEDHDFKQVERTAKAEAEQQQHNIKTIAKTVQAELEATLTDKDLKSALERLTRYSSHLLNSIETFPSGTTVEVELPSGHTTYGVVGRIVQGSEKGNPLALSNWRAEIYTQDFARMFPVRMSVFNTGGMAHRLDITPASITKVGEDIYAAFDSRQGGLREERTVLRGNLLAAYEKYQFGDFAYYTTQAGERLAGMIMPRGFDLQEELQKLPVVFRTPESVKQFLNEWTDRQGEVVTDSGGTLKLSTQTPEGLTLSEQYAGGSKFYRNEELIEIIGEDFYSVSDQMRAEVSAERVDAVLNYLVNTAKMQLYAASHIEIAREQLGQRVPELEWLETESPAVDSQPIQLKLENINQTASRDSDTIREPNPVETELQEESTHINESFTLGLREQELAAGAEILRIAERLYAYAQTVDQILPDETGEFWTVQNLPDPNYVIGYNPVNENFWVEGVNHSEMLAQQIAGVIDPDCTCDISPNDIASFQTTQRWLNEIGFEDEQSPAQTQALAQENWLQSLETREESAIESTPEPLVEPPACNIRDSTQWEAVRAALVEQHQLPERYVEALHQRDIIDADSAGDILFLQHRVEADFQRGEVVNAALYDLNGQFQALTAESDTASGYFWFQQGKGEVAQVVVVESGIEALAFAKSNARPAGTGTVYLATDQQQTVPLEAITQVIQHGGVVTLAEGVTLNPTQTEQLARLLMTGEPARTTQAQLLPLEAAPVPSPQPQSIVPSPQPPNSSLSIQDIREWYRQAIDIGRSEQHLNQIAHVGKAFGQGHALSQQDLQVMARDRATWRQQAETVAQHAQVILAKVGSELHNGIAFEGSKHYTLFATADQLYVLAAKRGIPPPSQDQQILPEQLLASGRGILLKAERSGIVPSLTRVNQADAERFEQVANRVQEQEHQSRTAADRLSR